LAGSAKKTRCIVWVCSGSVESTWDCSATTQTAQQRSPRRSRRAQSRAVTECESQPMTPIQTSGPNILPVHCTNPRSHTSTQASCCEYMVHNRSVITYALLSPPPGRSPWSPVPRIDSYGIGVDPSKRSAPGFAVSGDGGVDPGALRPSHRAHRPSWMGWSDG
jgi:hypothetical protein